MRASLEDQRQYFLLSASTAQLPLLALDMAEDTPSSVGGVAGDVLQALMDHSGNMTVTGGIALAGVYTFARFMNRDRQRSTVAEACTVPADSLRRFRRYGTAAIMGAAALANVATETKWGLETFPALATTFSAPQTDIKDAVVSTLYAGLVVNIPWMRAK